MEEPLVLIQYQKHCTTNQRTTPVQYSSYSSVQVSSTDVQLISGRGERSQLSLQSLTDNADRPSLSFERLTPLTLTSDTHSVLHHPSRSSIDFPSWGPKHEAALNRLSGYVLKRSDAMWCALTDVNSLWRLQNRYINTEGATWGGQVERNFF